MSGGLVERLRAPALARPSEEAFAFLTFADGLAERASLSYGELDRWARSIALELTRRAAYGTPVLLLLPPSLAYVASVLACVYAGAPAVPAYPPIDAEGRARVARLAADARPGAVVYDPTMRELGLLDGLDAADALRGAAWIEPARGDGEAPYVPPSRDPAEVALLQYTSGSTRNPRGVRVTGANLLANSEALGALFRLTAADRAVLWLPPFHDMGLIGGVFQPLAWGFPCTLMSPLDFLGDPVRWVRAVSDERGTLSGGPDFAFALATRRCSADRRAALDLSSWRVAFTGAEPVRRATLERFAEAFAPGGFAETAFYPCYGLAEATLIVTGVEPGRGARARRYDAERLGSGEAVASTDADARALVSCGRSAPLHAVTVVDPATGRALPERRVGEIWISGPSVADGYLHGEDAERFRARTADDRSDRRYLRTRDLGFLDDGELYVLGRADDVIVVRGRNHHPQDIEQTAQCAHAALRPGGTAAFVGPDGGAVLVQELARGGPPARPDDIATAVRSAVVAEQGLTLERVVFVPAGAVPKTSSGKVRRQACRALLLHGSLDVVIDSAAPAPAPADARRAAPARPFAQALLAVDGATRATMLEAYVREQLRRFPGAAPLDPALTPAGHGLDSLAVTELCHAIVGDLGVELSVEQVMGGVPMRSFLERLAEELERGAATRVTAPIPRVPR